MITRAEVEVYRSLVSQRVCRKLRYPSKQTADDALSSCSSARELGDGTRKECRAYRCFMCGGFHLTSQVQAILRGR